MPSDFLNKASGIKQTVDQWYRKNTDDSAHYPAAEKDLPQFTKDLFKEAKQWRENCLGDWRTDSKDIATVWRDNRILEGGNHWKVWGRRNLGAGKQWMHELQEPEIGNTIRVRKMNITGGWHDFIVSPNVNYIHEILDQERRESGWYDFLIDYVQRGLTDGTSMAQTVLNMDDNPDGIVMERLLDNESIFFAPFTTELSKNGNGWYLIIADLWNMDRALRTWPNLHKGRLEEYQKNIQKDITSDESMKQQLSFAHTKLVDHYEMWWDDPTTVPTPFNEQDARQENEGFVAQQSFDPSWTENHTGHMNVHYALIQSIESLPPAQSDQESQERQRTLSIAIDHMQRHMQLAEWHTKLLKLPLDRTYKYPNGRRTIIVGSQVADDGENPFIVPWRRLFHMWVNEKVTGSLWGRGVPEIERHSNEIIDTADSRFADATLMSAFGKSYFHIEDKEEIEKSGLNNDPTKPGFFHKDPPVFRKGEAPPELLEMRDRIKSAINREQGTADTVYGESPGANASAKLVSILSSSARQLISGEANTRLNQVLTRMMETRIDLYRQFYNLPRPYMINGQQEMIVVRDAVTKQTVVDKDGKPKEVEIKKFSVSVKPDSNFPNHWENDVQFFTEILNIQTLDPVTRKKISLALEAKLGERYPDFAAGGKYEILDPVIQKGMEAIQKEQEAAAQENALMKKAEGKIQNMGLTNILNGGSNGR